LEGHTVAADVGKTQSKVSLWNPEGVLVERCTRANEGMQGPGYAARVCHLDRRPRLAACTLRELWTGEKTVSWRGD
jgi:hypothetical protein